MQKNKKYTWMTFNIKRGDIKVESTGDEKDGSERHTAFTTALKKSGTNRYGVIDWGEQEKLIFIAWNPDGSKPRLRMVYASVSENFKSSLNGIHEALQASSDGDISKEAFDKCTEKYKV